MTIQSVGFNGLTKRPLKPHVIDDISFSKDFIVCTCAWKGPISEFVEHRQAMGLGKKR